MAEKTQIHNQFCKIILFYMPQRESIAVRIFNTQKMQGVSCSSNSEGKYCIGLLDKNQSDFRINTEQLYISACEGCGYLCFYGKTK